MCRYIEVHNVFYLFDVVVCESLNISLRAQAAAEEFNQLKDLKQVSDGSLKSQ